VSEPRLSLRGVRVRLGGALALDVPALDVLSGELLAVIGPNGAGKSTLLQVMAGLTAPTEGKLLFRQSEVRPGDVAYRRRLALVLQSPVLLDLSVSSNISLGLRMRGMRGHQAGDRAHLWAERLGVAHLMERRARSLSGGEAQRVSLARALALEPELLLLDEPFAALDAPTRSALLDDLRRLLRAAGTTTVVVTHDQDEALALGDRLAVLLDGRLRQVDTPERVFGSPADEEVAAFVGVEMALPGRVIAVEQGVARIAAGRETLSVPAEAEVGEEVLVCLRPEDVTLMPVEAYHGPSSARNRCRGRITRVASRGRLYHVSVDCGFALVAAVTPQALGELGLAEGNEVVAAFKATAARVIRRG